MTDLGSIVSRVILAAHKALINGGDGEKANPGSYRKQPVKVGKFRQFLVGSDD